MKGEWRKTRAIPFVVSPVEGREMDEAAKSLGMNRTAYLLRLVAEDRARRGLDGALPAEVRRIVETVLVNADQNGMTYAHGSGRYMVEPAYIEELRRIAAVGKP